MANITNLYLNENKRYAEDVVVTAPAVLNEGGGRANTQPTYVQSGEDLTASVIEADTIVAKSYIVVDEAFPASATATVTVDGTAIFTDEAVDAVGLIVSTVEDLYSAVGGDVVVAITSGTGDVTEGKLRVVLSVDHPSLKNGQYAN